MPVPPLDRTAAAWAVLLPAPGSIEARHLRAAATRAGYESQIQHDDGALFVWIPVADAAAMDVAIAALHLQVPVSQHIDTLEPQ